MVNHRYQKGNTVYYSTTVCAWNMQYMQTYPCGYMGLTYVWIHDGGGQLIDVLCTFSTTVRRSSAVSVILEALLFCYFSCKYIAARPLNLLHTKPVIVICAPKVV